MRQAPGKAILILAFLFFNFTYNGGYAEERNKLDTYDLEDYVVTATRSELTQKDNPRSVEVITKEEIKNMGAISVRDALRLASNIDIVSVSHGMGENISMRGGDTNDVLILVNGSRIAGESYFIYLSTNAFALDRLNLSNVERIEILRGQASAIYGSGAQSGVINIITKKPDKQVFTIGAATSTRESSNYYHFDSGKNGKISAVLDANFSKLRDIDSKANASLFYGPKQNYNLDIDYALDKSNRLNFMVDYAKTDLKSIMYDFHALSTTYKLVENLQSFFSERKTAAITYNRENTNSNYSFSVSYSQLNRDPSSVDNANTGYKIYKSWNIETRDIINVTSNNKLVFGSEYQGDKTTIYGGNSMKSTNQYSIYMQDEYRVSDKLLLIPAVRYDYHENFGSNTSPNLGITYFITNKSRFKANYGSSYRSPSVDELYGQFDHGMTGTLLIEGNPNLKPEKTRGYELSYEQEFSNKTSTKLTYFNNKKEEAISYQMIGKATYQFYNIASTSSKGVEFELKRELGKGFTVSGVYNYLDALDDTTGTSLDYSTSNSYIAKLTWTEPLKKEWGFTAWNKWYSNYHYSSTKIYSVNTFNFVVSKGWGNKYRVFAGVDNVFNKELSDMGYYGRLWRIGGEMHF